MQRELRITGEGRLALMPNVVKISLPIKASCKEYTDTIRELNLSVGGVHKILTKNKLEKTQLKTSDFNIHEDWFHYKDKRKKPRFDGYVASHDLVLEIPFDNELIACVLTDIANSGINVSFRLKFDVAKREQYNQQLVKNAIYDAKESAEAIAEASGVQLKEIINIDYSFSEVRFYDDDLSYCSDEMLCESRLELPDFSPDEIKANKNVTVVWRIE